MTILFFLKPHYDRRPGAIEEVRSVRKSKKKKLKKQIEDNLNWITEGESGLFAKQAQIPGVVDVALSPDYSSQNWMLIQEEIEDGWI